MLSDNINFRLYTYCLCLDADELNTFYKYKNLKRNWQQWKIEDRLRIYKKAMKYRKFKYFKILGVY